MKYSKEREVGAGEFKATCLQLIDEVSHGRAPIIITKHGKRLAMLVPYAERPAPLFGCMKGSVVIHGDITAGTNEVWEADAD